MKSNNHYNMAALVVCAMLGLGNDATAEWTGAANQFMPTKDVGIYGHNLEQMSSSGKSGRIRPLKGNQNVALMDFDAVAMQAYLNDNPGTAVWTLSIQPADSMPTHGDIGIETIESLNDWVEGDGNSSGSNWNWTSGTAAATYFYAQTIHHDGVLDVENSVPWIDPDSGPYTATQRTPDHATYGVPLSIPDENPTADFINSVDFLQSDLTDAYDNRTNGGWATVVIDSAIINAILTDENNRGLRFGPLVNNEYANWRIWDKDQSGGLLTPYLEVTVTPVENDGDYDEDSDIDGNDFLVWQQGGSPNGVTAGDLAVWQSNFGNASLLGSVATVPEPSSLLLVLGVVLCPIWSRRIVRHLA